MSQLDQSILEIIMKKTKMGRQAVRNAVSIFKNTKCPKTTQNAAAQLFAQSRGFSVAKKLKKEDRETLPNNLEFEKPLKIMKTNGKPKNRKIIELIKFDTNEYFLAKHIEEINRTYTYCCYTSTYTLCRKVIENILIDILRKKYPGNNKEHKGLYFDLDKGRFLDLKYILKNLLTKSKEFGSEEQLVKRLVEKANDFKDDANNKTHSLYHIVTKRKEIDDKNPQEVFELLKAINSKI